MRVLHKEWTIADTQSKQKNVTQSRLAAKLNKDNHLLIMRLLIMRSPISQRNLIHHCAILSIKV